MRSHYLFDSVFCNVAAAWEKGAVENLVTVRQTELSDPSAFSGLDRELNSLLLEWCEKERQKHNAQWNLELEDCGSCPKRHSELVFRHTVVSNKLSLVIYEGTATGAMRVHGPDNQDRCFHRQD